MKANTFRSRKDRKPRPIVNQRRKELIATLQAVCEFEGIRQKLDDAIIEYVTYGRNQKTP